MSRRRSARDRVVSEVQCACGRPTRDQAFICGICLDAFAAGLRDLQPSSVEGVTTPGLWDELLTTISGVQGVDYRTLGVAAPSESTGIVLNQAAVDVAERLRAGLRHLVRLCTEFRVEHAAPVEWTPRSTALVPAMAEWLSWRVDGLAWHAEAVTAAEAVAVEIEWARWVVDRPAARQQLGECPVEGCGGVLSAVEGATYAKCARCAGAVEAQPLRDQALTRMGARLCTAAEIAKIATSLGRLSAADEVPDGLTNTSRDVVRNRINQWAVRGHITPAAHAEDGSPRFRFGAVYDLLLEHERRHRHEFTDWRDAPDQPDPDVLALVRSCTYEGCPEVQTKTKRIPKTRRTTNSKGA